MEMKEMADFPFLSANILDKTGNTVFQPFIILQNQSFSFGITGVTSSLPDNINEVYLADIEDSVNDVLKRLALETDFQIVLFNGTIEEAKSFRLKFVEADYMFVSGATDNPIGRTKNPNSGPRMYRLGKQGKALGMLTLNINDPSSLLSDITELKLREEFISRQINRMKKNDPNKSLKEIFVNDARMLERAEKIEQTLIETKREIAGAINTSRYSFPPMDKNLEDEPKMLSMITQTISECNQLAKLSSDNKSTGS
tara:strand:- start:12341 stop:13105 length:765 start_codon:yes stop_codon:yes gene_type:complete